MRVGSPLIKNVLKPLAKNPLMSLGLLLATPASDAIIPKNFFELLMATLMISRKEMKYIMKIVKSLEESGLLIKYISERIENEAKEQKSRGTLGASLLGNLLVGKEVIQASEGTIRTGQDF